MPPRDGAKDVRVHHSFVSASSRFRSALATSVHAACSAGSTPANGISLDDDAPPRAGPSEPFEACALNEATMRSTSSGFGVRVTASRKRVEWPGSSSAAGASLRTSRRERARRLEERLVVQRRQRLERRVGPHAPHRAVLAAGRIERHEARIRRRAADEHVEPAAVPILPVARRSTSRCCTGCPRCRRAAAGRRSARRSSRLSRPLAASAASRTISASIRKRGPRASSRLYGSRSASDAGAADDWRYVADDTISLCSAFIRQPFSHELRRQPVEQLRMRRRRSLRAEIFARFDEAAAEELLPGAVDRDARRQRVPFVDEPARQPEAVRHLVVAERVQDGGHAGVDLLPLSRKLPRRRTYADGRS